MSDAILQDDELTAGQEYFIAGAVILLFGLLYWWLNHSSDIELEPTNVQYEMADVDSGKAKLAAGALGAGAATAVAIDEQAPAITPAAPVKAEKETAVDAAATTGFTAPDVATPTVASTVNQEQSAALQAEEARLEREAASLQAEVDAAREKAQQEAAEQKAALKAMEARDTPMVVVDEKEAAQIVYTLPNGIPVEIGTGEVETKLKQVLSEPQMNVPVTINTIYFDSGSTRIKAESDQQIKIIAALMNHYPERRILLRGHTDNTGNPSSNKQLSLMRANAVALAIGELGIDTSRMRILGAGEEEPVASNASEEGRKKNRRIEVFVVQ